MKRLHLLVSGALLLTLAGCAQLGSPQGWQTVGIDNDSKAEYALDLSSRQQTGDQVRFRGRVSYPQTVTPPVSTGLPPYAVMTGTWQMDCRNRTYVLLSADFLDRNHQLLKSQTFSAPSPQSIANNQSAMDRQYKLLCR